MVSKVLLIVAMIWVGSGALTALQSEKGGPMTPLNKKLPAVTGTNLAGERVSLPDDLMGKPAVLLVAYRRGTQADVDQWISLIEEAMPGLAFLEVPAISNPVWRPLQGWIDGGMRRGVPQARWHQVVTLYDDAPILKNFLGDYGSYHTHVALLDGSGLVRWFYAGGFNHAAAEELSRAVSRPDATATSGEAEK